MSKLKFYGNAVELRNLLNDAVGQNFKIESEIGEHTFKIADLNVRFWESTNTVQIQGKLRAKHMKNIEAAIERTNKDATQAGVKMEVDRPITSAASSSSNAYSSPNASAVSTSDPPEVPDVSRLPRHMVGFGNSRYKKLPVCSGEKDASSMNDTLRDLSFTGEISSNQEVMEMRHTVEKFVKNLPDHVVSLFYFSGHGSQDDGKNELCGTDYGCVDETFDLQSQYLDKLQSKPGTHIIILDCCRTSGKEAKNGSASLQLRLHSNTFVMYAAAEGSSANGTGINGISPYTAELLKLLPVSMEIEELSKRVRAAVINESRCHQVPWDASCLAVRFRFACPISDSQ